MKRTKKKNFKNYFIFILVFCSLLGNAFVEPTQVNAQECIPAYVVQAIDRSGSMSGSRLADAKTAAKTFTNFLLPNTATENRESLVSFNHAATTDHGWSNNKDSINAKIDSLSAGGGTNFVPPLTAAAALLASAPAGVSKSIIFLSDGVPGDGAAAITLADTIKKGADGIAGTDDDVIIFTIGLGVGSGSAAETRLKAIATSEGHYYSAPSSSDLEDIYGQIFLALNDSDHDGFLDAACPDGTDEDDSVACINPGAPEQLYCIDPATGRCPGEGEIDVCSVEYYCETYQCAINCDDNFDNDQNDAIDIGDTKCPAPGGLVPCGRARDDPLSLTDETQRCDFCHIFILVKRVIDFLVKIVVFPLLVLMLLVGGFFWITAAGSESRIRQGKDIIRIAVIATVIVLVGWVGMNTAIFFLTGQEQAGVATILGQPWSQVQCGVAEKECSRPAAEPASSACP